MKEAFDRGMAVGVPQIRTDSIHFRFKDSVWNLPTYGVVGVFAHYNGCYYEAKVSDIQKFVKEMDHG